MAALWLLLLQSTVPRVTFLHGPQLEPETRWVRNLTLSLPGAQVASVQRRVKVATSLRNDKHPSLWVLVEQLLTVPFQKVSILVLKFQTSFAFSSFASSASA